MRVSLHRAALQGKSLHFEREAIGAQGKPTVQRFRIERVLVVVCVLLAAPGAWAGQMGARPGAVYGVVRDASGVAQLGVLVQVTEAASATVLGRAFTDVRGRYLVANLTPGRYQVQASAALFAPALKADLQLHAGARAVVNLTLTTIFDTAAWLPAERRKADEPADDWTWTLRSASNRPLLRLVDDGELVMVSSSATESKTPSARARIGMSSGDGGFGAGGIHNLLLMDKVQEDGSGVMVRADTGTGRTQNGVGPSTELSAGFERQVGFASTARAVVSFQSHPELTASGGGTGFETMQMATAQRTRIGDLINLEVGGLLSGMHTSGYGFAAQPFLRVMVEPGAGWSLGYRMATARSLQSFSSLNAIEPEVPVAAVTSGKLRTERGQHQEISAGRKLAHGQVQVAFYRDRLDRVALGGGGVLSRTEMASLEPTGGVADTLTDSFRLLTASGYRAQGVNILVTQPISQTMWAAVEYSTGKALAGELPAGALPSSGTATSPGVASLPAVLASLRPRTGKTATFALKGALPRTGTRVRAVYRWQPHSLVTAVDTYREFSDQAFLSFHLRQPVRWDGVLPAGLEASMDVTNLLEQGYQPFLSSDGRTLYLAQSPRTLQAGLSINF